MTDAADAERMWVTSNGADVGRHSLDPSGADSLRCIHVGANGRICDGGPAAIYHQPSAVELAADALDAARSDLAVERETHRHTIDELKEAEAENQRLHSWDGLMELLDEHWPADIWGAAPDTEDLDPGHRIVALTRHLNRVSKDLIDAREQLDEVRGYLTYISSPTMGLPPGRDAAEYVAEADERAVRGALERCIRQARLALAATLGHPPAVATDPPGSSR